MKYCENNKNLNKDNKITENIVDVSAELHSF